MAWRKGGRGVYKNSYVFCLEDAGLPANAPDSSRVVWYSKGVVEVWLNLYDDKRYNQAASRKRVGKALSELFGTGRRWICDVNEGRKFKKKGYTKTTFCWYARMSERPDEKVAEKVSKVVADNAVEEIYEGTDVKTGVTVEYYWRELNCCERQKYLIRDMCKGKPGITRVCGKVWRFVE